ncbi:patched domain-containing protein 3-like [Centruroides sculpturatus]|uniref:patched domain-containing protein 3-like n=1 Tax=Centruroides sculpturatus TaxID=218467 RepID=UPI000C6EA907|nr:patched domain-containing protein 3-like [Centruroides sculpturatus]
MKLDSFNKYLSKKFGNLGIYVATYTSYFIITPVFVSLILATGLQKWQEVNDIKYLFAPDNTRHVTEEASIQKLFPMDLSHNASIERMNREPSLASVLITAKDGGSVLRHEIFKEILNLDEIIQNLRIEEIRSMKYKDLCAMDNRGVCFENHILLDEERIEMMENGNYSIKYPLDIERNYDYQLNSLFLGGVETNNDDMVTSAKAIRLFYYLNDDTMMKKRNAEQWQCLFLNATSSINFRYINVDRYATISTPQELNNVIYKVFPRIPLAIIAVLVFSTLTCLFNNWIESKPWIGVIALTSGGMALTSSFGLILYCDIPLTVAVGSIPFLILGIGMDDAFVFLAAWKKTDSKNSVTDRMLYVYSESAISVTITSITNLIAFSSGLLAPYRIIRYFCTYASVTVIFCYVYQITFVGACMALFGYLEKQNRHSLLFVQLEKSNEGQTWFRKTFLTSQKWEYENSKLNFLSTIWIRLGNLLSLWPTKLIVFLILILHVSIGLWGISYIDVVGSTSQSIASDSYLLKWYLDFLKDERISFLLKSYNISDQGDFIAVLRKAFLRHPMARRFRDDIAFNSNYTSIIGSRFFAQTDFTENEDAEVATLKKLREITDGAPFHVFPYHYNSFLVDDSELHLKFTAQMLGSIIFIVIIVCFIFMPDVVTTFSVAFSIICTEICTLGYMALWGIDLAQVSIVVLVMCAGFSVDFTAHFSHFYKRCPSEDHNQRLRYSISSIGLAIFQGSATTIISILPLAFPLASSGHNK